jgi:hypothetical protein
MPTNRAYTRPRTRTLLIGRPRPSTRIRHRQPHMIRFCAPCACAPFAPRRRCIQWHFAVPAVKGSLAACFRARRAHKGGMLARLGKSRPAGRGPRGWTAARWERDGNGISGWKIGMVCSLDVLAAGLRCDDAAGLVDIGCVLQISIAGHPASNF